MSEALIALIVVSVGLLMLLLVLMIAGMMNMSRRISEIEEKRDWIKEYR